MIQSLALLDVTEGQRLANGMGGSEGRHAKMLSLAQLLELLRGWWREGRRRRDCDKGEGDAEKVGAWRKRAITIEGGERQDGLHTILENGCVGACAMR